MRFLVLSSYGGWYFQATDLIRFLRKKDVTVDIITYNVNFTYHKIDQEINLKQYSSASTGIIKKVFNKVCPQYYPWFRFDILCEISWTLYKSDKYDGILLIDKGGIGLFEALPNIFHRKAKLFYWSLELYLNPKSDIFKHQPYLNSFFRSEKKALCKINYLLIQDEARRRVFTKIMKFHGSHVDFPVSVVGHGYDLKQSSFNNSKIYDLIYFGVVRRERGLDFLKDIVSRMDSQISILLHGPCQPGYKKSWLPYAENITVSNEITMDLDSVVNKGRVGLVWYDSDSINDSLTGSSSEKIARYLRLGIPLIYNNDNDSYDLIKKNAAGEYSDGTDLPAVLDKIKSNYEFYSENAMKLFNIHYKSERYFNALYNCLLNG
ncbi:glycosyltransferase family protein [Luteibaculum oceani]|uniref:Glycosyltransferase family 4 protein n=1 Tax=Luteibaculum oceani TaxID=1294296 RepID=A0A5C6VCV1_9FLAO|nr:glycosyltransferase family 4 protein [Luteibaculum oceani]TXC81405.1 glycosyltransferase family 4 protein [Luteibaculum oceani]